jgi:GNAT superfamily N-acetyltransferase
LEHLSCFPGFGLYSTSFNELTVRSDTLVLVAELDAEVIGYLLASYHGTFFANGAVVWIEEKMVAKSARDSGVGRLLMGRAEEWAAVIPARCVMTNSISLKTLANASEASS